MSIWPQANPELRRLWGEGLSTAVIGERLGVSKNAVVGHAHKIGLPPRPSPIKRTYTKKPKPPKRAPKVTLALSPPVETKPLPEPKPVVSRHLCCWPFGDPGTPSFRWCNALALEAKPYCDEHFQLAYVKVRQ